MYIADIYVSPQNYALVGVGFTFTILAIIFVVLRIFTRLWLVRNIGVDDAFIVVSALGTLGFLIGALEQIRYGLGEPVDLKTLSKTIQATVASVIAYTICHLAVKLSISFQCLRIFESTVVARRIFISLIVFLCIYGTMCLLMTIITCWPVAKYWDDSIPGKCMDSRALRYAFAGINIVNDIALLVAPMPFLSSLQIARRAKFVLIGVFACGGAACIIAIIRLYSLYLYSSVPIPQRPLKGIDIALWSSLECNIAIMCACVPALKPMFVKAFPGFVSSFTHSSSKNRTGGRYAHGSLHDYDNISHPARSGNHSHLGVDERGIKVQQSFEMRTTAVSDDNDSEKNLVTSNTAIYAAGSKRVSAPTRP
ncbi:Fc.00g058110.m01.CDS01 [Cosmosporella sp. VM-42]